MAGDVTLDADMLATRLKTLITLYDDVDSAAQTLTEVQQQQTTAYWSDEPSVGAFVATLAGVLSGMSTDLSTVRDEIDAVRQALAASAKALTEQDEQIADLFRQLAAKYTVDTTATTPSANNVVASGSGAGTEWHSGSIGLY